jgi:DNA-binding response OmpR family regulator
LDYIFFYKEFGMDNASILIVEDEKDISDIISLQLQGKGHNTKVINDGDESIKFIQDAEETDRPDLIILDRMLPGVDGIEICKFLRFYNATMRTPILMVTALTRPEHIIEGLDAGADDYITKPFDTNILLARVKALLRRSKSTGKEKSSSTTSSGSSLQLHGLKVDIDQCKVWKDGKKIDLTLSEYKLLCIFLKEPGKVFTRLQLMNEIQEGNVHVTARTIDTHVFGLRKKLGEYSYLIETIRGIGYRVDNSAKIRS